MSMTARDQQPTLSVANPRLSRGCAGRLSRDERSRSPQVPDRTVDGHPFRDFAEVIGHAFVTEPMMTWPLGGRTDDIEERRVRANALFLEPLMDRGIVWETADGHGAL